MKSTQRTKGQIIICTYWFNLYAPTWNESIIIIWPSFFPPQLGIFTSVSFVLVLHVKLIAQLNNNNNDNINKNVLSLLIMIRLIKTIHFQFAFFTWKWQIQGRRGIMMRYSIPIFNFFFLCFLIVYSYFSELIANKLTIVVIN